jgi:hypothetical protein
MVSPFLRYLLTVTLARVSTVVYKARSSGENSIYCTLIVFWSDEATILLYLFRKDNEWSAVNLIILLPPQHQSSQEKLHPQRASFCIFPILELLPEIGQGTDAGYFKEPEKAIHIFQRVMNRCSFMLILITQLQIPVRHHFRADFKAVQAKDPRTWAFLMQLNHQRDCECLILSLIENYPKPFDIEHYSAILF